MKIQSKSQKLLITLLHRAPLLLFVITLMLAAFLSGVYVTVKRGVPYELLRDAYRTGKTLFAFYKTKDKTRLRLLNYVITSVDISPDSLAARRFEFIGADELADPILVMGGLDYFAEYCPDAVGCLAVEYDGRGEVRHAYPYHPDKLETAPLLSDFPHEQFGASFVPYARPVGASTYSNGDLLAVFSFRHSFPFAGGVARINRKGQVIWFRRDYSHHIPYMTDGDVALVPSLRVGEGPVEIKLKNNRTFAHTVTFPFRRARTFYTDFVHVIDGNGQLLNAISVLDAILESPFVPSLRFASIDDPTHLNFVHQLREDAGGAAGIAPGDLVVSLRDLDAFGILDGTSHQLKRLVRGSFFRQHSVMHLEGAKFLMFDNWGGDGVHGPSRLLMVDLANGEETTIFPNDTTPEHLRSMFSEFSGLISISPDRRRVIVTCSTEGTAVEVRLADGAVLVVYTNLHDISHLVVAEEKKAIVTHLKSVKYMTAIE